MTTLELIDYYVKLLIIQYTGQPKAEATIAAQVSPIVLPQVSVQTITFSVAPASGTFILSYGGVATAAINWDDSVGTIQSKLRALSNDFFDLADVVVTGSIAGLLLTVTFTGVFPPAELLEVDSNTLATSVDITITDTDKTLPLAVQDAFNLVGDGNLAVGVQLDIIGKYVGVVRTGRGFFAQITLNDADFLSLIHIAIIQNSASSSLAEIQSVIHQFFPGQMLVFDYQNMQLNYLISSAVGSPELIQLFITQNLLPKPMAVQVALIIYAPVIDMFFGFRTYSLPAFNSTPFNTYADYHMDWPWLSYSNAISA